MFVRGCLVHDHTLIVNLIIEAFIRAKGINYVAFGHSCAFLSVAAIVVGSEVVPCHLHLRGFSRLL